MTARTVDIPLKTLEDLRAGGAVYQDFTNRVLAKHGHEAPMLEPFEASGRLARIVADNQLLLYDHFLFDIAGHTADVEQGLARVSLLDGFLTGVLETMESEAPDSPGDQRSRQSGGLRDALAYQKSRPGFPLGLEGGNLGSRASNHRRRDPRCTQMVG